MKSLKSLFPFLLLLILSYWSIQHLFASGSFPIHDDTQVARVFEMSKALKDGMFPVRWVADLGYGYGYPIFNFYAPLAYYVGAFFNIIGFDPLTATEIMMGIGMVLAGVLMYLFAKEFWGRSGGLIAALLYLYAPYHALDLYVRGDVAELYAYAFIPLAFYGLWKTYKERKWSYVILGSIGYAAIITSHNLTAMMITPFLLVMAFLLYIYARREEKMHKPYFPVVILVLGILLAGFYWLPVFGEMKYTNVLSQVGGGADYKDHFVCIQQLWNSPWGFGGSTHSCLDGLSYKIGKLHILLSLSSLAALWLLWKKERKSFGITLMFVLSTLFAVFLMLKPSQFLWDTISPMAFFQYPWRFLLVTTFFISFLGGSVMWVAARYLRSTVFIFILIAFIAAAIVLVNMKLFVPQLYLVPAPNHYTNTFYLQWTASRISDEYMPKNFFEPATPDQVPQNKISPIAGVKIEVLEKTNVIIAEIEAEKKTEILVNHAYFPGWHVYIDGEQIEFKYFRRGLLIPVPQGIHTVVIKYSQTPIQMAGNALTLTGVIVVVLGIITQRKGRSKHAKKST
jgi:uncharacterized membrane protein